MTAHCKSDPADVYARAQEFALTLSDEDIHKIADDLLREAEAQNDASSDAEATSYAKDRLFAAFLLDGYVALRHGLRNVATRRIPARRMVVRR